MTRKPISDGLDFLRGDGWVVLQFSAAGAQRYADKRAAASGITGAVGLVWDCGAHYRVNVAGQPFKRGG